MPAIPLVAALMSLAFVIPTAAQVPLEDGDVVCVIGNGLAGRMQHDGWTETLIQSASGGKKLSFRNLGFTGDSVTKRPRSKGVPSPEEYLKLCKADVIFVMFGYNESFGGDIGLAKFADDLGKMLNKYRGIQFNGESPPRIVLFSPIAHEDLKSDHLPNGEGNNGALALYSLVIQQVAGEKGVAFVDLFGPSRALYENTPTPLTLNGVHLNSEGNKRIGEVIASAVTGKTVAANTSHERLRKAVLDKNWHWHNRYRAVDGNDIWGSRAGLKFVKGQTNREVLLHELEMLDVMTANRDKKIQAIAAGRDHTVSDANVPPPVEVISNIGGGSRSSNPAKEGSKEYISGQDGLARLSHPDAFEINLFADESRFPGIANPVQLQVDAKGRLWAACWNTYPKWEPLKPMTDSLMILPDEDRDGVADKAIEFARVHNPLGFEFWNGGVIVTSMPDILFLKDTDGDDKADVRIVLVQGLGSADTHHSANNLTYGPDGGIYWQSGIFLQNAFEHPWGAPLHSNASGMYRFDPRRYTVAFHADNRPNPHGSAFDYWGYHYATDGTSGKSFQIRPEGKRFKMHKLADKQVRPVPASSVVSSANFPDEYQQDFLICNAIGYLGIKRYKLHREGFDKPKHSLGEVWGTPTEDFLLSDDKNFRPTDAEFGEDGALYVADWHNIIIGHMQYNIRDPSRDKIHGRIYRMTAKGRPLQEKVAIDGQPIPALLENLKHPIDGVRQRTRIELSGRDSREVIAAAREWIKQFEPKKKEDAHHLLEALWLHQQHDSRNPELLEAVLNSPEPHARVAAATVKHHWGPADPTQGRMVTTIEQEETKIKVTVPAHLTAADAKLYKLGAEVFARDSHCITCHQENGAGLDPIYPPLAGSPWVTGNEERLIKLTLHGLYGPIEVKGKKYDPGKGVPPMTPFQALLKDEEIAAVLTFVRNSWGNKAGPVKPGAVGEVRAATKDRTMFWKPEELLKLHPLEK